MATRSPIAQEARRTDTDKNAARILGGAFLFQAVTPLVSGLLLLPLVVSGDIGATMTNVANHALQVRASIVGQALTAVGISALGFLLYRTLKKEHDQIAVVALGAYLMEAAILAATQIAVYSLLRTSQEFVTAGASASLQTLGTLFNDTQSFGNSLLMLPFGVGATLFYSLLVTSRVVPRSLALFGLAAALLAFVGILFVLLGVAVPILAFLPNLPFELGIGIWLVVRGFSSPTVTALPVDATLQVGAQAAR